MSKFRMVPRLPAGVTRAGYDETTMRWRVRVKAWRRPDEDIVLTATEWSDAAVEALNARHAVRHRLDEMVALASVEV